MRVLAGFWLGVMVVVLTAAAIQLSPVDVEQNNRLSTIEAYLFATPTAEWYVTPSPTATFFNATNTHAPAASPTRPAPTPTFVPTRAGATSTTVPLATQTPTLAPLFTRTPTPTPLPAMVLAENIAGVSLWVRVCPSRSCEILARVQPGETVAIDAGVTADADSFGWVQLWNAAGWVAYQEITTGRLLLRWR